MGAASRPDEILADVPAELWGELLRAVRRAVDRLEGAQVPTGLRPFARWTPEALRATDRARRAVAGALSSDARFRQCVADALDGGVLKATDGGDPGPLRKRVGAQRAFAVLAARGHWEAVTQLGAEVADELAAADQVAAEGTASTTGDDADPGMLRARVDELARALRAAHRQLEESDRQAAEARRRGRLLENERDTAWAAHTAAMAERDKARAERDQARADRDRERTLHRERLARLRRRARFAERRAAASDARRNDVLQALRGFVERLEEPLPPPVPEPQASAAQPNQATGKREGGAAETKQPAVPRRVASATPGRPCLLPPGVDPESPAAVRSLLQVAGLQVLVDGYNVTKDVRGVPDADLEEQRHWLVRLASGVVGRFGPRVTLVFDGQRDLLRNPPPKARGVLVVFTDSDELADERLVALVDGLDASQPVLVVSSDRELRQTISVRDCNTVSSSAFLAAVSSASLA